MILDWHKIDDDIIKNTKKTWHDVDGLWISDLIVMKTCGYYYGRFSFDNTYSSGETVPEAENILEPYSRETPYFNTVEELMRYFKPEDCNGYVEPAVEQYFANMA